MDKSEQGLQEDFLNPLTSNGIPPHEFKLKINCPVMLLRNINHSEGLYNGTRLTCRKFEKNVIVAEITAGEYFGKYVFLLRIPFIPLQKPIFYHGQLYVVLSKAKRSTNIKVPLNPTNTENSHSGCTKNIVYKKILSFIHQ
ncbi:uncharacterized protein LOC111392630 [Olea europaea var. sylvestris]|uniref:uncharacterized protein LOC111392630 n=1 Tax=Olea europaea var. sylvestris TaxID=158386 RepID=UPI000C1D8BD6|nr:uncharacterized protein LOC111392630 [Olea europaea var. sylvestris]